jgi:hypothetical protein
MHKITLVCSGHRESGRCNSEELLNLLRAIQPDVVFEEMRPSDFDLLYSKGSVEAHAITKFREFKVFQPVPVDTFEISENILAEIKKDFDRVVDCVTKSNEEYRSLNEICEIDVHQHGFQYLNSAAFAKITARMSEIENEIIGRTGNQSFIRGLERWRQLIQRREHEMVGNIYEYCRKNIFGTGVFLVGAAHKMGIVKEIEGYAISEANLIDWNFP